MSAAGGGAGLAGAPGREGSISGGLLLVRPAAEHESAVLAYRSEFLEHGESMDGTANLRGASSYAEWLERLAANSSEATVGEGKVPATTFLGLRQADGALVGMIDIRHRLNEYLLKHGGHIGYSVRRSQRRQGYAKAMLALALDFCRRPVAEGGLGLSRVLISCDKDNPASARTILAFGGVLENEIPDEGNITQRYWVDLG
ncbi:MAG: GNAT family N-acetyltransferase [Spirochaetes bacterium]|nr:GNAT family N-acetyltransferase [Spirochaetota bacterium]MBU0954817.1 GNAT family N-acetyltransferase [Spirochaetota bacterium]